MEIQFLDHPLCVDRPNRFLKTKLFSKLTDNDKYLDVRSWHQKAASNIQIHLEDSDQQRQEKF